jgi:hypothetical protein
MPCTGEVWRQQACSGKPSSQVRAPVGAVWCPEHARADCLAVWLTGGEIRAVNGEPASAPADRWGQLTRGPRLSASRWELGVKPWGVRNVLCSGFSEKDKENDFPEIMKSFQKSYLKIYSSKNCETNFVVFLMSGSTV